MEAGSLSQCTHTHRGRGRGGGENIWAVRTTRHPSFFVLAGEGVDLSLVC